MQPNLLWLWPSAFPRLLLGITITCTTLQDLEPPQRDHLAQFRYSNGPVPTSTAAGQCTALRSNTAPVPRHVGDNCDPPRELGDERMLLHSLITRWAP